MVGTLVVVMRLWCGSFVMLALASDDYIYVSKITPLSLHTHMYTQIHTHTAHLC